MLQSAALRYNQAKINSLSYKCAQVGLLSLLSKDKSFALPIIGNPTLNKLGLHTLRIRLADLALSIRRFQVAGFNRPAEYSEFKQNGVLVLDNFLPNGEFQQLLTEIRSTMNKVDETDPIQNYGDQGFGQKHNFKWGFDRFDGDTLNRFYSITDQHPNTQAFVNNPRLTKLTRYLAGTYHDESKYDVYKLHHGKEDSNADSQKLIHRDTFHSAIKLWYFLEDVKPEHGPFHYAAGTNRMSRNRLAWEKQRSIKASLENTGGAFRISEPELNDLKDGQLKSFPVKANTLVIADIRGFHCRGAALENQDRLSIYANIRPSPYLFAFNAGTFKKMAKIFKGKQKT